MVQFVDAYRADWVVEPIDREIQIVPSQCCEIKVREVDASRVPSRQIENTFLAQIMQKVYDDNLQLYGARKVWHALKRSSVSVARCTVERLMRQCLEGVRRSKPWNTTIPDGLRTGRWIFWLDSLKRSRQTACGWPTLRMYRLEVGVYVAFVMDMFHREVVGWKAAKTGHDKLVSEALGQAIWARGKPNGVIHHSDGGSQYLSITYSNRLCKQGFKPSVGSLVILTTTP